MTIERWTDDRLDELAESVDKLVKSIEELRAESKEQNIRFTYYQQASQWVVNLAFGLIVSATIITIIAAVFPR